MRKLKEVMDVMKDKASQGKAVILSNQTNLSLLRATTHDYSTPPSHKHLSALLSSGDRPRATASATVELLMDRLQTTQSSAVALKCLIAVHHIIRHGTFILRDQLSVYPYTGGRNYLNLSNFRHNTNPTSWELSCWVRWFAQHIEQLLCTSRILGSFFLGNSYSESEDRVSGLTNADLLAEFDSLVSLVEGFCKRPGHAPSVGNKLVDEIVELARGDWGVVEKEVRVRVGEFGERLGCLKFGEAVELVCCVKRLEECEERVRVMMMLESSSLWDLAREVKEKAGMMGVYKEESRKVQREGRKFRVSESDRFSGRVLNSRDFVRFPSGRLLL